ncbi:MAG: response regulator [Bacteroidota bacterium]|jgi:CheY-like chemotaxis protein
MKYAIICVDDEPVVVDLLRFQLSKLFNTESVAIETFTDPKEVAGGITDLLNFGIDVIFLVVDYQMPDMTGVQLIRSIHSKHPKVKFFMVSGQANTLLVQQLMEEGLLEKFIAKPWSEAELADAVKVFIDKYPE